MTELFIISLAVLAYIFAGYPVLLWVLSSVFGRNVRKDKGHRPSMTLLISAYNEEATIRQKLENSLELDYPREKLEIIVASESTDGTDEAVKEYAERGVTLYAWKGREGKRATLYKTVPLARGEIIVFSDANAMYGKDALKKLAMNFSDKRIGCVSGRLKYTAPRGGAAGKGEAAYWEFEFILKMMASRLFSLGGCGGVNGSIFAVRKELYNPIDRYRGDDFEISCRVEIGGRGVVMEPEAVSYEKPSQDSRQEFKRKVRLAAWNFKSALMLLSEALSRGRFLTASLLFSHRLLRYTTPVWLVLLAVSSLFLPGSLRYAAAAQLIFYSAGLAGLAIETYFGRASKFLTIPSYFFMVNCAAFLGIVKGVAGRDGHFWEKAR